MTDSIKIGELVIKAMAHNTMSIEITGETLFVSGVPLPLILTPRWERVALPKDDYQAVAETGFLNADFDIVLIRK